MTIKFTERRYEEMLIDGTHHLRGYIHTNEPGEAMVEWYEYDYGINAYELIEEKDVIYELEQTYQKNNKKFVVATFGDMSNEQIEELERILEEGGVAKLPKDWND